MRNRPAAIAAASALIASLVLVLPASPAAAQAGEPAAKDHPYRDCGNQNGPRRGWYNLRAYEVKCAVAKKRVAGHYKRTGQTQFNGWDCEVTPTHPYWSKVNCIRTNQGRHQHVRFAFYDPHVG